MVNILLLSLFYIFYNKYFNFIKYIFKKRKKEKDKMTITNTLKVNYPFKDDNNLAIKV